MHVLKEMKESGFPKQVRTDIIRCRATDSRRKAWTRRRDSHRCLAANCWAQLASMIWHESYLYSIDPTRQLQLVGARLSASLPRKESESFMLRLKQRGLSYDSEHHVHPMGPSVGVIADFLFSAYISNRLLLQLTSQVLVILPFLEYSWLSESLDVPKSLESRCVPQYPRFILPFLLFVSWRPVILIVLSGRLVSCICRYPMRLGPRAFSPSSGLRFSSTSTAHAGWSSECMLLRLRVVHTAFWMAHLSVDQWYFYLTPTFIVGNCCALVFWAPTRGFVPHICFNTPIHQIFFPLHLTLSCHLFCHCVVARIGSLFFLINKLVPNTPIYPSAVK